jgi:hypothetical protein
MNKKKLSVKKAQPSNEFEPGIRSFLASGEEPEYVELVSKYYPEFFQWLCTFHAQDLINIFELCNREYYIGLLEAVVEFKKRNPRTWKTEIQRYKRLLIATIDERSEGLGALFA